MQFTDSHEYIALEGEMGRVGISRFGQKELGQIVYLQLPEVGRKVAAGEEVVILESTKAAADLYAPASGEIVAINERLLQEMDLLTRDPEGEGWLFKMRLDDPEELSQLLSQEQYDKIVS
jgi:glycine cleavage system H protein